MFTLLTSDLNKQIYRYVLCKTKQILHLKTFLLKELPDEIATKQPIVLFDGECSLCNNSVRFLIRHNKTGSLNFASLQSPAGSKLLRLMEKDYQQNDTLLLIQDNKLYGYSNAAIKIASHLEFPWRLLIIFRIVPIQIRDFVYRHIAVNRYTWFGRKSFCMTDLKGIQERFLS